MFIKPNFLLLEYLNRSPQEKKKKELAARKWTDLKLEATS